jgi:hypothetical protein
MNNTQRMLVIATLVVIGVVLAFLMLGWGSQFSETPIFAFYDRPNAKYPNVTEHVGIYTEYGIGGILLGVVAPLCLWAAAAFVYLGRRKKA